MEVALLASAILPKKIDYSSKKYVKVHKIYSKSIRAPVTINKSNLDIVDVAVVDAASEDLIYNAYRQLYCA